MRKRRLPIQAGFDFAQLTPAAKLRPEDQIFGDVTTLLKMWRSGQLGGEVMPEDVHPKLDRRSKELAHYFTLGMALNYQRNSYSLWIACTKTFEDADTMWVFSPGEVSRADIDTLREALVRYKVALQPNKHVQNWHRICCTLADEFEGDIRNLISRCGGDIQKIKSLVTDKKKGFPYLGGVKIMNYWLYVMLQYTDLEFSNRSFLNVAPDTHVVNASIRLGLIDRAIATAPGGSERVADRWKELLTGKGLEPIDVHTPLWLWSRGGFRELS